MLFLLKSTASFCEIQAGSKCRLCIHSLCRKDDVGFVMHAQLIMSLVLCRVVDFRGVVLAENMSFLHPRSVYMACPASGVQCDRSADLEVAF